MKPRVAARESGMLIVDDFLTVRGQNVLFIFRQIYDPVDSNSLGECSTLRAQFVELSSKLETGEISPAEFNTCGGELLRDLERIERHTSQGTGTGNTYAPV
jgi:hypothetical protein